MGEEERGKMMMIGWSQRTEKKKEKGEINTDVGIEESRDTSFQNYNNKMQTMQECKCKDLGKSTQMQPSFDINPFVE